LVSLLSALQRTGHSREGVAGRKVPQRWKRRTRNAVAARRRPPPHIHAPNRAAVHRDQLILCIISEALAASRQRITIVVVGLPGKLVIRVEGEIPRRQTSDRRGLHLPIANRIKPVANRAIIPRRAQADRLIRQPVDAIAAPGPPQAARVRLDRNNIKGN
jgi:hypothetical protein